MSARYHIKILDNGDWAYFIGKKQVDVYDYRQAVAAIHHEERLEAERLRDEQRAQAKGAYITKQFNGGGIPNKQLAKYPWLYHNKHPSACFTSFKDLEQKAKAAGMVVNNFDQGE
jgi:hypothetical protein